VSYRIVITRRMRQAPDHERRPVPGSVANRLLLRFKRALLGAGMLVLAGGIVVAALIVGSFLAGLLLVCFVLLVTAALLKLAWRRMRQ
jgi:hypothetical protein